MNMSHSALFYLNQGICYQRYGDFVYLRHIDARRDYLFNGVVYDILRCFSQKEGRTKEEAEAALLERYSLSDRESFRREMDAFLERLTDEGILRTDQAYACADLPAVLRIQEVCAEKHLLFSAALELTYRCNARCIHCYVDDAHGAQGQEELTLEEFQAVSPLFAGDVYDALNLENCMEQRSSYGGPAVAETTRQIQEIEAFIQEHKG